MSIENTTAERVRQELNEFRQRTGRALDALTGLRDVEIGPTPKDLIYSEDKLRLYRYRPLADESTSAVQPGSKRAKQLGSRKDERPVLLICYALINRPYMLDLQEDRSVIRQLLKRDIDVFLIDWGYPDGADRYLTMADYVDRYLPHCAEQVCRVRGIDRVNMLGICQGGTLSLCFAALHPEYVKNLVTMVTPVDFQTDADTLSKWARAIDVDALVATLGNVPGEFLNAAFLSVLPFRLMSQKYVSLLDAADSPAQMENFVRMEKWIFDSPDQPGEMFRQYINWCYKENRLRQGTLEIDGKQVDLKSIKIPVLNIYALQDHLVPPDASRCLADLVGSKDYKDYPFKGGHIGIYVSTKAQTELPEKLASWLHEHDKPG